MTPRAHRLILGLLVLGIYASSYARLAPVTCFLDPISMRSVEPLLSQRLLRGALRTPLSRRSMTTRMSQFHTQKIYLRQNHTGRKANRLAGHNSQVRPLPNVCGSFGGFECMVLELVGLSAPHAHHDRCRYVESTIPIMALCG